MRYSFLWAVVMIGIGSTLAMGQGGDSGLPDPGNATWHIGLYQLFGQGQDRINRDWNLNIYAVFENGRFSHALGSARSFNTSLQFVEKADIKLEGLAISGRLSVRFTPDQWVPLDHQTFSGDAEIIGRIVDGKDNKGQPALKLEGTYKMVMHGSSKGAGPDKTIEGTLIGGVGRSEPGWDNARLHAYMAPIPRPGEPTEASIAVDLGCADGKVHWGMIGTGWTKEFGGGRRVAFDASGLKVQGPIVTGTFRVPYRAIDITCQGQDEATVELTFYRVQGMVGGKLKVTAARGRGGQEIAAYEAYGRGGATKGLGGPLPYESIWNRSQTEPWFAPVAGFVPPAPGEHPRLLFRKKDVEALRRKAQTPQGKAILARLGQLLDGKNGDTFPTVFNTTPPDNHGKSPKLPAGAFTSFHGPGYGLLYQLTGDRKYADLGRQALEAMFAGKADIDNRYYWSVPGTTMRAGTVMSAVGMTYDLCYDGWDGDFRRRVVTEIQKYDKPLAPSDGKDSTDRVDLLELVTAKGYPPGSNHYGAYLGAGVAVLAILGDEGVDTPLMTKYLNYAERHAVHMVYHGFGDGGFYPEGHHPPRLAANSGYLEFVTALRNAAGRDYAATQPNVDWITLRWLMEVAADMSFMHRGVYGGDTMEASGSSHDGEIPNGFATIKEKYKPALLWFYNEFYSKAHPHWGAATYPHRAVISFVYWPEAKAVNPAGLLPKAYADTIHAYFYNRRSWQDVDDIIVTHAMETGPRGYYDISSKGMKNDGCWLKGLGFHKLRFPAPKGPVTYYATASDGSSILSAWTGGPAPASMAVDFSGASGAEALLVSVGKVDDALPKPDTKKATATPMVLKVGDLSFNQLAVHTGAAPKATVEGDTIRMGQQTIKFDGKRIVLGTWKGQNP